MNQQIPLLQPGDHLLYEGNNIFDMVINVKTWSLVSHIEIYAGDGKTVASRNGRGVDMYNYSPMNLHAVLRPSGAFDFSLGMKWFDETAKGQKYDWKGLLCFALAVKQGSPNKMFCSEFANRFDNHAGFFPFNYNWDSDKIAPGNFLMSPAFSWIYVRN